MQLGKNEQHQKSLSLLQLFSYKTYQDYLGEPLLWLQFHFLMKPANKDMLPPLNQAQIIKLKHLSIVSLATTRRVSPMYWGSFNCLTLYSLDPTLFRSATSSRYFKCPRA